MIADYDGDISNLFNVNIEGELPILATRNMAMFPGVITPVIIGRKQRLNLLNHIRKTQDASFAVFCQHDNAAFDDIDSISRAAGISVATSPRYRFGSFA